MILRFLFWLYKKSFELTLKQIKENGEKNDRLLI